MSTSGDPDPVIELVDCSYDDPVVMALVAQVQEEYVQRYGGPDGSNVEPGEFLPPDGLFLVALDGGVAVATGGWRRHDERSAELKRMFVVGSARRRGLARLLLGALERRARAAGYDRLVLNTGSEQPEATALYESCGYEPSEGYGRYAMAPKARFFAKQLAGD